MNPSVRHDTARKLAYELVEIIASCLRQEEQHEALREFYETIRAGLDEHDAKKSSSSFGNSSGGQSPNAWSSDDGYRLLPPQMLDPGSVTDE